MTRIALGGFMGSGKSTIGPIVADRLSMPFVDLDDAIVSKSGCTIAEIFAEEGEPSFRALETSVLKAIAQGPPVVLALGGGTLHQDGNDAILSGFSIFVLEVPWDSIRLRLTDGQGRPLWKHAEELYRSRLSGYRKAGTTIEVGDRSPVEVADFINAIMESRL